MVEYLTCCYTSLSSITTMLVVDVNECIGPSVCGVGGTCVNKEGSYDCTCHTGFIQVINNEGQPNCTGEKQTRSNHFYNISGANKVGNFITISP